jgi:hypothetical protein
LISDLITVAIVLSAALLAYAVHRPVLAALRRFETRNAERRMQEFKSAMDRYAHYRQTLQFVDEQIEPVTPVTVPDERTGEPATRYVFMGTWYGTLKDAEAARYAMVVEKAREFYVDLDRIFLSRFRRTRTTALTDPSKHQTWTPPKN